MAERSPVAAYGAMTQLPHGRHGLPPQVVAEHQRRRLMAALALAVHELGLEDARVNAIVARARVSKRDFYAQFDNRDDCFAAAYALSVSYLLEGTLAACQAAGGAEWPLRVKAGLGALVEMLASDPPLASLILIGGPCAGRELSDCYEAALDQFAQVLASEAPRPPGGAAPTALERAVVGGVAALLSRRVFAAGAEGIGAALPGAVEFALTPYLGAAAARRIVSPA